MKLKLTEKQTETIEKLDLRNEDDILNYYPKRYIIYNNGPFSSWQIKDYVSFKARIISAPYTFKMGYRQSITRFKVETIDQIIDINLFNRPWISNIHIDDEMFFIGQYLGNNKVNCSSYGNKTIIEGNITPIYALKKDITNKNISNIIKKVYKAKEDELSDIVPQEFIQKYKLLSYKDAIKMIHFPKNENEIRLALRTLKYEEFLTFNTTMAYFKESITSNKMVKGKNFDINKINDLINHLPFKLTNDQQKALNDILNDLKANKVMYRLVQGDVSCGKTIIAMISMYAAYLSKTQSAILAPTEILARQHFESLKNLFKDMDIKIELLCSSLKTKKKQEVLENLKNGDIDMIVGTHSLFQDDVIYHNLGLVITDEQHRFGVEQRKKLKDKGYKVDFLLMSATPIPRTLASTIYGDMDISIIESMPLNRKKVTTKIVSTNSITTIKDELFDQLNKGHQIYIVCNAIEKNNNETRNVLDIYNELVKNKFFLDYKLGVLHGKMDIDSKEDIMKAFLNKEIDVLITTTVIEVGVNVENATCMVIYDANNFGLSQLHQLRGRVIRGSYDGYCYLLTKKSSENIERLKILEKSQNGFEIAEFDLKLRGPGDLLGQRQSGLPSLIIGDIVKDEKIFNISKIDSQTIIEHQDNDDYKNYLKYIIQKNERNLSYID